MNFKYDSLKKNRLNLKYFNKIFLLIKKNNFYKYKI